MAGPFFTAHPSDQAYPDYVRTPASLRAYPRPEQIEPGDPFAPLGGSSLAVAFELDVLPGLTVVASEPNLKSTAYGMLADFLNVVRDENKEDK